MKRILTILCLMILPVFCHGSAGMTGQVVLWPSLAAALFLMISVEALVIKLMKENLALKRAFLLTALANLAAVAVGFPLSYLLRSRLFSWLLEKWMAGHEILFVINQGEWEVGTVHAALLFVSMLLVSIAVETIVIRIYLKRVMVLPAVLAANIVSYAGLSACIFGCASMNVARMEEVVRPFVEAAGGSSFGPGSVIFLAAVVILSVYLASHLKGDMDY